MTKILIIEDTAHLRESITEALELEGFEILQASDGETGINMALQFRPDLILCDIVMPGIDGYEVLQALKSETDDASFPFIFITALAERKNYREGMELGADDYLIKPFTVIELLKAIKTRLQKHRSVESRIKIQLEKIEADLNLRISQLNKQIDEQEGRIHEISKEKTLLSDLLKENQALLLQEALRTIEINNTMQFLSQQLSSELQKTDIGDDQRAVLVNLRNRIRNKSVLINNWTAFQLKFDQVYPKFSAQLLARFPKLTREDLLCISAIFINMDTRQLSVILSITAESVRKTKYRLKKKLGLGKADNLIQFIAQMGPFS